MGLSDLHILPTKNRPEFNFNPAGVLKIKGRSLLMYQDEVTNQIWNWIDGYINNPAKITYVNLEFEYLNSFSSVFLVNILNKLSIGIWQSGNLVIRWYYEEEDEDILDQGKAISSILSFPIEFILIDKIDRL